MIEVNQLYGLYAIYVGQVPRVLIVQMPRFGKKYKMYDRILPSPKLRINDLTMAGIVMTLLALLYTHLLM